MTRRYEIQDILTQDADGVVFHAVDRESGRDAVLRRLFPRGRDGGGLEAAEQEAFLGSVERLKNLEHKALRKVIDGGCDPVDGMPFLVTEWVEGPSLAEFSGGKALETASVKGIVELALEASRELSKVLGEEALWVGCGADVLIVPESGRGITFWVSPFRTKERPGLLPLADLVERLMQWTGRPQIDSAGEGLAGWIRQIRANPSGWSLKEAMEALNRPAQVTPTVQIRRAPGAPTVPAPAAKKAKRKSGPVLSWALSALVLMLACAGVVWKLGGIDQVVQRVREPSKAKGPTREEILAAIAPKEPVSVAEKQASPQANVGALAKASERSVTANSAVGRADELSGKIVHVRGSTKGQRTRYLEIEINNNIRLAGYRVSQEQPGLELADLKKLVGRQVRISGEFLDDPPYGKVLFVRSRADIVEQP